MTRKAGPDQHPIFERRLGTIARHVPAHRWGAKAQASFTKPLKIEIRRTRLIKRFSLGPRQMPDQKLKDENTQVLNKHDRRIRRSIVCVITGLGLIWLADITKQPGIKIVGFVLVLALVPLTFSAVTVASRALSGVPQFLFDGIVLLTLPYISGEHLFQQYWPPAPSTFLAGENYLFIVLLFPIGFVAARVAYHIPENKLPIKTGMSGVVFILAICVMLLTYGGVARSHVALIYFASITGFLAGLAGQLAKYRNR